MTAENEHFAAGDALVERFVIPVVLQVDRTRVLQQLGAVMPFDGADQKAPAGFGVDDSADALVEVDGDIERMVRGGEIQFALAFLADGDQVDHVDLAIENGLLALRERLDPEFDRNPGFARPQCQRSRVSPCGWPESSRKNRGAKLSSIVTVIGRSAAQAAFPPARPFRRTATSRQQASRTSRLRSTEYRILNIVQRFLPALATGLPETLPWRRGGGKM